MLSDDSAAIGLESVFVRNGTRRVWVFCGLYRRYFANLGTLSCRGLCLLDKTLKLEPTTMQQVKIFKVLETEVEALEQDINTWLADSGARIVNITANLAPQSPRSHPNARETPSDVFVMITYEIATTPVATPFETVGLN